MKVLLETIMDNKFSSVATRQRAGTWYKQSPMPADAGYALCKPDVDGVLGSLQLCEGVLEVHVEGNDDLSGFIAREEALALAEAILKHFNR